MVIRKVCVGGSILFLALVICAWLWSDRLFLPSQRTMIRMSPDDLRQLVLVNTPVGTKRSSVENVLRFGFRRSWERRSEAAEFMSRRGFRAAVSEGDYYLRSDLAVVGVVLPTVVTIRLLFDREDKLKDVSAEVWDETL